MYYVVVVVGISLSVLSSIVVTKAAVLETKFKRQEAERADAEAERKRKEGDAEAERKTTKEGDAEAERKRKEEVEAERKRKEAAADDHVKEAVRIEKAASEWATMLNNFMVARTLRKGDLTELVNNGFTGVPRELVPRVLEKLKKRTSSELQYCEGKFLTNKEEGIFLKLSDIDDIRNSSVIDPLDLRNRIRIHEKVDIGMSKEIWDIFFSNYGDEKGSAFEITKCYENKTKDLPDYFELNNCERNKRLEYLGNCGGRDDLRCPCKTSEADIVSLFDAQKNI